MTNERKPLTPDPKDCSEIGLLILNYMAQYNLTFSEMAQRLESSRAALRASCLKNGCPGKRIRFKLSQILDKSEAELWLISGCQSTPFTTLKIDLTDVSQ